MRILMTGGTGLIGRALCRYWIGTGEELVVVSRRAQRVSELCSGAQGVGRLEGLDGDKPFDAVVNLAGAPIADRPWTIARRKLLWSSRIDTTRQLVDWMGRQSKRPETLLSGSAVGWYGDSGETLLDESSPAGQTDFGAELCQAWEREAERAEERGIRVVLLRTAPVLSASGGMLARLRTPYRLGIGGPLGSGRQWMPWIHIDDQVALIDYLLRQRNCVGAFNASAPEPVRNAQFAIELAKALHRPAAIPFPAWALRLLLGEMSILLLGGQRTSSRRLTSHGFSFRYPLLQPALCHLLGTKRG